MTTIDVSIDSDRYVLTVSGDMDEPDAGVLTETAARCLAAGTAQAAAAGGAVLLVDLGGVTFLGSAGLNALARLHTTAQTQSASVRLRAVPRRVQRVLAITGLDGVLHVEPAC